MNDDQIKHMVNRFLGWKLPKDFQPDAGIKYTPLPYADKLPPSGTNLFDATQADAMVRYMVEGMPGAHPQKANKPEAAWLIEAAMRDADSSRLPGLGYDVEKMKSLARFVIANWHHIAKLWEPINVDQR